MYHFSKYLAYAPLFFWSLFLISGLLQVIVQIDVLNWAKIIRLHIITGSLLYLWRYILSSNSVEFNSRLTLLLSLVYTYVLLEFILHFSFKEKYYQVNDIGLYALFILVMAFVSSFVAVFFRNSITRSVLTSFFLIPRNAIVFITIILISFIVYLSKETPSDQLMSHLLSTVGTITVFVTILLNIRSHKNANTERFYLRYLVLSVMVCLIAASCVSGYRLYYALYLNSLTNNTTYATDQRLAAVYFSKLFRYGEALRLDILMNEESSKPFVLSGKYRIDTERDYVGAREIFDKGAIITGEHAKLLKQLQLIYGDKTEILEEVWGGIPYITLQDFEDPKRVKFRHYVASGFEYFVDLHQGQSEDAWKGNYSEKLRVRNVGQDGYNYWFHPLGIQLERSVSSGLRVHVKSNNRENTFHMAIQVSFKKGRTAVLKAMDVINLDSEWALYYQDNLFERAESFGKNRGWNTDLISVDGLILNAYGKVVDLNVDEIQFY